MSNLSHMVSLTALPLRINSLAAAGSVHHHTATVLLCFFLGLLVFLVTWGYVAEKSKQGRGAVHFVGTTLGIVLLAVSGVWTFVWFLMLFTLGEHAG